MNSHEIGRLTTEGNYGFRIYCSKHNYKGLTFYVGAIVGSLQFENNPPSTPGYQNTFVCENEDEVLDYAKRYITKNLGLKILAWGPYDDDDEIDDILNKAKEE